MPVFQCLGAPAAGEDVAAYCAGVATWMRVASLADLAPGTVTRVRREQAGTVDDVALVRDADGSVHALDDTCTHFVASLSQGRVEGGCLVCPAHGARFHLYSGVETPTRRLLPVRVHRVEVRGTEVYLLPGDVTA
jgi:3-phenylpropionate/trans-cinnamate dioxygenase ferredoxin subunit